ncbi:hypothetical protein BOO36_17065 [Vibrio navarrensis]|uniref:hypothetical protein n=1 Tax=Vibrio navarrensis TaxID=29495 RepID=UPI00186AAF62|nr:hypothetical protein [Vibrio navarrensis]MBE4575515.1 hypothetical protein [Vibrio navarrensis]
MSDIQTQLMGYIVKNVEKSFFNGIRDKIYIQYGIAEDFLTEHFQLTPKGRLRPQMCRYLTDEALAEVGGELRYTNPRGEHYLVADTGSVVISHLAVKDGKTQKEAVHRKLLSLGNKILEPFQPDMFKSDIEDLREKLHVVIYVIQPNSASKQQGVPEGIFIAVPFSDWTDYHAWLSIDEMLSMYESEEILESDGAWPKLKIALRDRESKQGNSE